MTDYSDSADINDKCRKSWSQEEDNILTKLVKKYGTKRWTDISKAMVDMFDLVGKTGKQCRERWVNHLDPKINKLKWTIEEERKIFDAHKIYGNKWKVIAKNLDNRTDNSIKNHFYSILRKGLRRINKMMGDRKSTQKVKDIRTSVLSKLSKIQTQITDQNMQDGKKKINVEKIYDLLFQFSSMKSENISEKNLTDNLKQDFRQMIVHLMNLSSQQKIKKQQNILQNKQKKLRKNSQQMSRPSEQDEFQEQQEMSVEQNIEENQENYFNQDSQALQNTPKKISSQSRFMVQVESPQKSKQKSLIDEEKQTNQVQKQNIFFQENTTQIDLKPTNTENPNSILQKQKQTQNQCQIQTFQQNFPNITINLQELSCGGMSQSKDGYDFNQLCFINSPMFNSSRMYDQFNIRTPRIYSPGAFNFCSGLSTAHSYGNYMSLTAGKDTEGMKSSDNQLDKIIEQLRSKIDDNCNQKSGSLNTCGSSSTILRINSSRNANVLDPYLRNSCSSSSLTPKSSSSRVH